MGKNFDSNILIDIEIKINSISTLNFYVAMERADSIYNNYIVNCEIINEIY